MVTEVIKDGKKVVNIQLPADAETLMTTVFALLRSVGLTDKETPLTPDELYYINELIAAMLPTAEQIKINANYHDNGKPVPV